MKKRLISTALAIILVLSLTPFVLAEGAFSDVPEGAYYFTAVNELYSDGVVNGVGGGAFAPNDKVLRIEAIAMLVRTMGYDISPYASTDEWHSGYTGWALANGLIDAKDDVFKDATREEAARYITIILDLELSQSDGGFNDTDSPYAYTLRDYGIILGFDNAEGKRVFGGELSIARCDICVMLWRLKHINDIKLWTVEELFGYENDILKDFPQNEEDIFGTVRYMIRNGVLSHTFNYSGLNFSREEMDEFIDSLFEVCKKAYNEASVTMYEYVINYDGIGYETTVSTYGDLCTDLSFTVRLYTRSVETDATLGEKILSTDTAAITVVKQLYGDGILNNRMTDTEIAKALLEYTANYLEYDISHSGTTLYDVLESGKAVCEGYTALYNSLCHYAGLKMLAVTGYSGQSSTSPGSGHIWSEMLYEDNAAYIDSTWGDMGDEVDYKWFWISWEDVQTLDPGRTMSENVFKN